MISLSLITAPAVEPISIEEAAAYLRVDTTDEHGEIARMISAARSLVEERTRRKCMTQTWDLAIDAFPVRREPLILPFGPLQSVTSITTYSTGDVSSTWSNANYVVDTRMVPGRVYLTESADWPRDTRAHTAGVVRFVCGHGADGDAMPEALRHAMKVALLPLFERRTATPDEDRAIDALVAPWMVSNLVAAGA